jgi:hypothetical protein
MSDGPTSRRLRKLLRVSMRTMIVLVLVVGGGMGWLVRGARIQRAAAAAITGNGGSVMYDWEWNAAKGYTGGDERVPKWLSDRIGVDYFGHITSVWLRITTDEDTALVPVTRLAQLQELRLSGSSLSDTGLARLSRITSLSRLDMDYSRFSDAGLENLKGLTRLSVLSLNGTRLTDAGLAHLKGLTSLTELNIAGTRITDAGLAHLKGLTSLTELNIASTRITDAGMAHLGLRNLSVLNVMNTRITDAGVIELCQARPGVRISR